MPASWVSVTSIVRGAASPSLQWSSEREHRKPEQKKDRERGETTE